MVRDVLFVTMAPNHASAHRRRAAARSDAFRLISVDFGVDKVSQSLLRRLLSGRYLQLASTLMTTKAAIVWAWGIDVALVSAICLLLRPNVRLVWDISDINPGLLQDSLLSKIFRLMEQLLVRRASRLFITSPAYYERYYRHRVNAAIVRVIENRKVEMFAVGAPSNRRPLVVVYAGIFRSPRVLECMTECARRLGSDVAFRVYGYPNRTAEPSLSATRSPGLELVELRGAYRSEEISKVYEEAHLVWGFTDPLDNDNEKWLLSNRIYDAIVSGRPIITNAGTMSGDYVQRHRLGLAVDMRADAIVAALGPLLDPAGRAYRELVAAMPPAATGYMDRDYGRELEALLNE